MQLNLEADDPWEDLTIYDPNGEVMLRIKTGSTLKTHGMSELVFQSAEPNYAIYKGVSRMEILQRFPEGAYTFAAKTMEGGRMLGSTTLSHEIPVNLTITSPVGMKENAYGDWFTMVPPGDLLISWEEASGMDIHSYQVIVTSEEDHKFAYDLRFAPTVRQITIPGSYLSRGQFYVLEVLVHARN